MANDYISTLLSMGNDQLQSQYEIKFPNGIPGTSAQDMENIMIRTQGAFTVPEEAVGSYDIFHKGLKLSRPNGLDESTKELTLEVRMDEGWTVYEAFKRWKNRVFNPLGGTLGQITNNISNSDNVATLMQFSPLSTVTHNPVLDLFFHYTIIRSLSISDFDYSGGDPIALNVTFNFFIMSRSSSLSSTSPDADSSADSL